MEITDYLPDKYFLTGPQPLTVSGVAACLTQSLEHDVQSEHNYQSRKDYCAGYAEMNAWHIDTLIEQFVTASNGGEKDVTEEVRRITG